MLWHPHIKSWGLVVSVCALGGVLPAATFEIPIHGKVGANYSFLLPRNPPGVKAAFKVSSGKLPKGMEMTRDGHLQGTPLADGDFPFSVVVSVPGGQNSALQDYELRIDKAASVQLLDPRSSGVGAASGTPAPPQIRGTLIPGATKICLNVSPFGESDASPRLYAYVNSVAVDLK